MTPQGLPAFSKRLKTPKEKGREEVHRGKEAPPGPIALGIAPLPVAVSRQTKGPGGDPPRKGDTSKPKAGNVGWRNVPGPCPVSSAQELLSLCLRAPFLKQEEGRERPTSVLGSA